MVWDCKSVDFVNNNRVMALDVKISFLRYFDRFIQSLYKS